MRKKYEFKVDLSQSVLCVIDELVNKDLMTLILIYEYIKLAIDIKKGKLKNG